MGWEWSQHPLLISHGDVKCSPNRPATRLHEVQSCAGQEVARAHERQDLRPDRPAATLA